MVDNEGEGRCLYEEVALKWRKRKINKKEENKKRTEEEEGRRRKKRKKKSGKTV